jgi:hypothetical protein
MAAIAVALEHSVIVAIMAVHTLIQRLGILLSGLRFKLMMRVSIVRRPLDVLHIRCICGRTCRFLFGLQPEFHAVSGRHAGGFPLLVGSKA